MTCQDCARHVVEINRLTAAAAVVAAGAAAAAKNYRERIHHLEAELALYTVTGKRTRTRRSGVRPWAVTR